MDPRRPSTSRDSGWGGRVRGGGARPAGRARAVRDAEDGGGSPGPALVRRAGRGSGPGARGDVTSRNVKGPMGLDGRTLRNRPADQSVSHGGPASRWVSSPFYGGRCPPPDRLRLDAGASPATPGVRRSRRPALHRRLRHRASGFAGRTPSAAKLRQPTTRDDRNHCDDRKRWAKVANLLGGV